MDRLFAQCVDLISLAGPQGLQLHEATSSVVGPHPRPALLHWLAAQLRLRPHLFTTTSTSTAAELHVIAHETLRTRALGLSTLEHAPLHGHARAVLEHVGRRGADGVLQCELASLVNISPVMVQHYVGGLTARRLVARRKLIITHKRRPEDVITPRTPSAAITYTAVIVLARFAAQIATSTAARPTADGTATGVSVDDATDGVVDVTLDTRIDRVLAALRAAPPYIRSQRDLKIVATPDAERRSDLTVDVFLQRRHRAFRAVRTKLLRTGLVAVCRRACVGEDGRPRGVLSCIRLTNAPEPGIDAPVLARHDEDADGREAPRRAPAPEEAPTRETPAAGRLPRYVAEVDLVEQVYQLLMQSGAEGMSVPELRTHLDGGCDMTSAMPKRIRNIITGMSRTKSTKETQRFEGSAMHLRISFAEPSDSSAPASAIERQQEPQDMEGVATAQRRLRSVEAARRRGQLSTLGRQRRQIVTELLASQQALVLETVGREVAKVEDSGLHRVDQKVMKRIINDLVSANEAKVISTTRPSMEDSRQDQIVRLLALPQVVDDGDIVRGIVNSLVARSIHGGGEEKREAVGRTPTPKKRKKKKRLPSKPLVSDTDDTSDDEDFEEWKASVSPSRKRRRSTRTMKAEGNTTPKATKTPEQRIEAEEEASAEPVSAPQLPEPSEEAVTCVPSLPPEALLQPVEEMDSVLLVQSQLRDTRKSRLMRLRALDYGWMKGKLARIRMLHEKLFDNTDIGNADTDDEAAVLVHSTVEAAQETAPIGKFTIYSCLRNLTVAEYGSIVGIYQDLGDAFETIRDSKIADVLDVMRDEIMSVQASRVMRSLISILMKLGLMESAADSSWILSGAGIIRDFGKGMPFGVVPHSVVFTSRSAVDVYWKELQHFSNMKFEKGLPKDEDIDREIEKAHDKSMLPVLDVYVRVRWNKTLHHGFLRSEQRFYEAVLQRLSGVEVIAETLTSVNLIMMPLRRFSIEELYDAVHDATGDNPNKSVFEKSSLNVERLLAYSRFRTKNAIPKGICRDPNAVGKQPPIKTLDARENTSMLHVYQDTAVAREPPSKRPRVARSSKTVPRAVVRGRAAEAKVADQSHDITLELDWCICLLCHVMKGRALSYCQNNLEILEWKNAASLITFDNERGRRTVKEMETEKRNARKALTAIFDNALVRAAVDILALKLAMGTWKLEDDAERKLELLQEVCVFPAFPECIEGMKKKVETVLSAAVIEIQPRLEQDGKFNVKFSTRRQFCSAALRRKILEKGFDLSKMRVDPTLSLPQRLVVLCSRYRRVTEVSLRGVAYLGVLFRTVTEKESSGNQPDTAAHRKELLEQVITAVLREKEHVQNSDETHAFLRRFDEREICRARNRMLLRGVITSHDDKVDHCFEIAGQERLSDAMHFLRRSPSQRDELVKCVADTDEACGSDEAAGALFDGTRLWKDICSNRSPDSGDALEVATQLIFFPGHGDSLSVTPTLGEGLLEMAKLQNDTKDERQEDSQGEELEDGQRGVNDDAQQEVQTRIQFVERRKGQAEVQAAMEKGTEKETVVSVQEADENGAESCGAGEKSKETGITKQITRSGDNGNAKQQESAHSDAGHARTGQEDSEGCGIGEQTMDIDSAKRKDGLPDDEISDDRDEAEVNERHAQAGQKDDGGIEADEQHMGEEGERDEDGDDEEDEEEDEEDGEKDEETREADEDQKSAQQEAQGEPADCTIKMHYKFSKRTCEIAVAPEAAASGAPEGARATGGLAAFQTGVRRRQTAAIAALDGLDGTIVELVLPRETQGIRLTELLRLLDSRGAKRPAVARALQRLLARGVLWRFACEEIQDGADWDAASGVLYMAATSAAQYASSGAGGVFRAVSLWTGADGRLDERAARRVCYTIVECVTREPGIEAHVLAARVCNRVMWAVPRGVLDAAFELVRMRGLMMEIVGLGGKDGLGVGAIDGFVDAVSVLFGGRRGKGFGCFFVPAIGAPCAVSAGGLYEIGGAAL